MNELIEFAKANKDGLVVFAAIAAVCMTALTSIISFVGIIYQKRIDLKSKELEAIRKLYDNNLEKLGDSSYEVLAQATILIKKFEQLHDGSPQEFLDTINNIKGKISNSKQVLIDSRRKHRYILIGVEDAFQKIARIGDWVKNLDKDIPLAKDFVKRGTKLRKLADQSIIKIHRYGTMPSWFTIVRVKYHCWRSDRMWEKSRAKLKKQNGQ